jgi:hypothetical protein
MNQEITITLPEQPADQAAMVTRGQTWAEALVIATPEDRRTASTGVAGLKKIVKEVEALFEDPKRAASAAHKAVCAAEKTLREPIVQAIAMASEKMLAYDRDQDRIRREAEAKLRAEAERQAAAERARLEAIARRCKDEAKREAYEDAAQAVVPVAVSVAPPDDRAPGEIRSKRWRAELVSLPDLIKAAAAGDPTATMLLAFDQVAATKAAGMFRRDGVVPGVRFVEVETISHRGA